MFWGLTVNGENDQRLAMKTKFRQHELRMVAGCAGKVVPCG